MRDSRRWRAALPARSVSLDRLSTSPYTGDTMRAALPARRNRRSPSPRSRPRRRHARAPAKTGASSARATASASKRRPAGRCRNTRAIRRCSSRWSIPAAAASRSPSTRRPSKTRPRSSNRASPGLAAQGLTIERVVPGPHNGVQVDARAARRNQALRQLYVVRNVDSGPDGKQAVVITLAAPGRRSRRRERSVRLGARPPHFETPVRPDAKPTGRRAAERALSWSGRRAANVSGSSPRNRPAERRNGVGARPCQPAAARTARPCTSTSSSTTATGPLSTQPRLRSAGAQ